MAGAKVLIADSFHPLLMQRLDGAAISYDYLPDISASELPNQLAKGYVSLIIRSKCEITETVLSNAPHLKLIARGGAGLDNIDVEAAGKRGILTINAGEANAQSVAEHTLGMLLSLLHNISKSNAEIKQRKWLREENRGIELGGKTVGVIGYGNTGSAVAQRLLAFNVEILVYDKFKKGFGNNLIQEVSMKEIFESADIVTFHIPLNGHTNLMVNTDYIHSFVRNIFLLNLSRGEIFFTPDIVRAIEFLSQEMTYVNELQSGCYPAVLSVLARGSVRGIASRTLSVIETILGTTCCGVDPLIIMEYSVGLPDEINAIIGNILQTRCVHQASFLEVAASAIDSAQGANDNGCQHILKSSGYRQLLQLSKIYLPSSTPSENLQADLAIMVRSLVKKLSSALQSSNEFAEDNRDAQVMLLSLSVMPMHCHSNFSDQQFRDWLAIMCEHFITSLEEIIHQTLDGSAVAALHCTIWLLFLAQLKKCTNSARSYMGSKFELPCISQKSISYMTALIYPDLLSDSCVMPSAIAFAMQQREPLQLLFESIGNLQDSTFDSGKTDRTAIIHYSNLIATVVLENSKVVRNLVQERFSAALSKCDKSSESTTDLVDSHQSIYSSSSSLIQAKEEDVPVNDYMNRTNLLENAALAEIEDLEASVGGNSSFLACFLPLFLKLLVDEGIPGEIRVSALRTLSAYMRCSRRILSDHVQLLETYITTSDSDHPQQLRLEALLIWIENFDATPVNVHVPVRGLINSLERANLNNGRGRERLGRKSESTTITDNSDVEQSFLSTTIQSMHCLVKENKLRDPAEYTLAIGIPYAIENITRQNRLISDLQDECSKKLLDIFVGMPSLLTRTLYQLCLPMQPLAIDEALQEVEAASSIGSLIVSIFDESHRLRIVRAIVQLAKSDDLLATKLEEVDIALTDQVLRGHHSFALAALSNFDVTAKSAKAIKEAVDLGSINHLDHKILRQLEQRMERLSKSKISGNDDDIDDDSFIEGGQQHQ